MVNIDNRDTGDDDGSNGLAFIVGGLLVFVLLLALGWFGYNGGFRGDGADFSVTADAPAPDVDVSVGGSPAPAN